MNALKNKKLFLFDIDGTIAVVSVCLAAHCKVHSHFRAFSCEVISESLENLRVNVLCRSELVLICPCEFTVCLFEFLEVLCTDMAQWALFRSIFTFMYITANQTSEFLCHSFISLIVNIDYSLSFCGLNLNNSK